MHGPRRVITFCLLIAVLPTVLLVIPLYLRHSVYADVAYEVTESEVLKIVEGISSIFCQEHSLKMNTTFTAYQLGSEPTLSSTRKHIHMKKSMVLPDDTLEYWGFHLLEGSTMVLSACSRYEGGRVMIVRGDRNLKTCGLLDHNTKEKEIQQGGVGGNKVRVTFENKPETWVENSLNGAQVSPVNAKSPTNQRRSGKGIIGEEEINLEGGEVSGEDEGRGGDTGSEEVEGLKKGGKVVGKEEENKYRKEESGDEEGDEEDLEKEESKEEEDYLDGSGEGNSDDDGDDRSRDMEVRALIKRLIRAQKKRGGNKERKVVRHEKKRMREFGILKKLKSEEIEGLHRKKRSGGEEDGVRRRHKRTVKSVRLERLRRELGQEKREEAELVDGGVKHGGTALNYTKRESEEDSDSSFEMGLKECYGGDIEFQDDFSPSDSCSEDVASEDTDPNSKEISKPSIRVEHEIRSNGYYYYIFYSDNDLVINEVHAAFDIHKTVYEKSSNKSEGLGVACVNTTECTFPVGFLSGAIVIVEVPTRDGIDRDIMDEVGGPQGAVLISSCHPRMSVYIIFPVAVLFLILGCAFL